MAARTTARYLSLTAICHIRLQEIFHHSRRHVTEFANNLYYRYAMVPVTVTYAASLQKVSEGMRNMLGDILWSIQNFRNTLQIK